jgi:hypothetical protein
MLRPSFSLNFNMIINYWHTLLNMSKHDLAWHIKDIEDEFTELKEARGFINRWSELCDISYTYTRAKWTGHQVKSPVNSFMIFVGYFYMIPKYTLRYLLFRFAGKAVDSSSKVCAVRNPKKLHKLSEIAKSNNIDEESFLREVEKRLRYWPLLK